MTTKLTPIPDTFLTELEGLQVREKLTLSPAFQNFLAPTAARRAILKAARKAPFEVPYWQTVRPSMIRTVAKGASYWTSVDLLEKQLQRVLHAYIEYFNLARPHQGIQQQVPQGEVASVPPDQRGDRIISVPVLGGLHHEYQRVA